MRIPNLQKLSMACVCLSLAMIAPAANAGLVSLTNNSAFVVDNSTDNRSVTVTGAESGYGTGTILDVNISIDLSKCGGTADTNGCIGDGSTFNREIVYWLEFAAITVDLVVQDTYSGQSSNVNHAILVLDDEALAAVGGSTVNSGSFQPVGALSAFDGLSAAGTWTLFGQDTVNLDPMVMHSFTLDITTEDARVPEPATLVMLGLGLAGLSFARKRRRS
jgi:hypothetical protein